MKISRQRFDINAFISCECICHFYGFKLALKILIMSIMKVNDQNDNSQAVDSTLEIMKGYLQSLDRAFEFQEIEHNINSTQHQVPRNADRNLAIFDYTIQQTSAPILPAIHIDGPRLQSNVEATDKVDSFLPIYIYQKGLEAESYVKNDWNRPRSKSLEPGAIEEYPRMGNDSSDICSASGNSSKGFLGFSNGAKFGGFTKTGFTSPNESQMFTSKNDDLIELDENDPISENTSNDFLSQSQNAAALSSANHFNVNKSFSGYAKRLPPSAGQSTAGLSLLHSSAVSQGLIAPVRTQGTNRTLVSGKTPFRAKSSDLIYENVIELNSQGFRKRFDSS
jgi:hypothetical protein